MSLQHSSLLTSAKQMFGWTDFVDATVQLRQAEDFEGFEGVTFARLALELLDGCVVPLRSYYTTDVTTPENTQAIIRAFRDNHYPFSEQK